MRRFAAVFVWVALILVNTNFANAQTGSVVIRMLDRGGAEISDLTDGNSVQLSVKIPLAAASTVDAKFFLDGSDTQVANCSIQPGSNTCSSQLIPALGWYWGADGSPRANRVLRVTVGEQDIPGALDFRVSPRPVVMVHGFISSWETWKPYLGLNGYLASIGLQGFAVGDGQEPGVLNTGDPSNPAGRTNSIKQNAEILGQYIAGVQKTTGAEKVDLLVHSMGGMITRYYLDRVMQTENVAQVIFLGSPMAGSSCTYPLAALGYLMPATQEILPYYMVNVFNQQILHRHGVPFHMVAGTLLIDPLTSPCAEAPSDSVVALGSAKSIQLDDVQELPMYHGNFTNDQKVFEENVKHLLQSPPGSFAPRPDLAAPAVSTLSEQFSRVYGGHLQPGESAQVTIEIDPNVTLANFSLYDSSRSLDVEVRGASGNVIVLDVSKNGLMKIEDPATMLYLGYGFKQPKPGKWVVTLKTSAETPSRGADYAMTARFMGGVTLTASTNATILEAGQPVTINARLQTDGAPVNLESATALVHRPDGEQENLTLSAAGEAYSVVYQPRQTGLHSVEVIFSGKNADGFGFDRASFLAFEIQPGSTEFQDTRIKVLVIVTTILLLVVGALLIWLLRIKKAKKARS